MKAMTAGARMVLKLICIKGLRFETVCVEDWLTLQRSRLDEDLSIIDDKDEV
jgi:hypothetical protein